MKNILIIDDEKPIRNLIKSSLGDLKLNIYEAISAETAYEYLIEQNFDLVITDIILPNEDGLEVIKEINRLKKKPKIIAISGSKVIDKDLYLKVAKEIGADAYFAKPFSIRDFREKSIEFLNS